MSTLTPGTKPTVSSNGNNEPKPPEALSVGRYTERLWGYKDQVGSHSEMGRLYERDRADFWYARFVEATANETLCVADLIDCLEYKEDMAHVQVIEGKGALFWETLYAIKRGSQKAKVQRCVCGEAVIPDGELRVEVGTTTHRLAGPCFQTPAQSEGEV